jgi:hypothetical protein
MAFKNAFIVLSLSILFCFCSFQLSIADDAGLGSIDKNESYDIYYGYGASGDGFVVKRVRVVRVDQINSLEFLVFINDSGFNAKGKEGFILFSTINAIVPSSTFSIDDAQRFKKY